MLRFNAGISDKADFDFPIRIERSSRRKTLAIHIKYGEVLIKAPQCLPIKQLNAMVTGKINWIRAKIAAQAKFERPKPKRFVEGERFPYLGRHYRLQLIVDESSQPRSKRLTENVPVQFKSGSIRVRLPASLSEKLHPNTIKQQLTAWYRSRALSKLTERTNYYAAQIGLEPGTIRIRSYKARWGSCAKNKDITYNWLLIMVPPKILDYVVVHELCHIFHYDHSAKFWAEVVKIIPDHKERSLWLKNHSWSLTL